MSIIQLNVHRQKIGPKVKKNVFPLLKQVFGRKQEEQIKCYKKYLYSLSIVYTILHGIKYNRYTASAFNF